MTISKIMWLGLRTDREKTIYAEAFWEGVNSTLLMRKDMGLLEKERMIDRSHAREVQRAKTQATKGNDMARLLRAYGRGNREVESESKTDV